MVSLEDAARAPEVGRWRDGYFPRMSTDDETEDTPLEQAEDAQPEGYSIPPAEEEQEPAEQE